MAARTQAAWNANPRRRVLQIVLHWLLAVLIVAALVVGRWLAVSPAAVPGKLGVLALHMSGGMLILALTIVRMIMHFRLRAQVEVRSRRGLTERVAQISQAGLNVLVVLVAGTGLATAIAAGLNRIVFQGTNEPLPADFTDHPTFIAHGAGALMLAALIVLHVAAIAWRRTGTGTR